MAKNTGAIIFVVILIILILGLFVFLFYRYGNPISYDNNDNGDQNPSGKLKAIQCSAEQKQAEFCTKEYIPVCGWFSQNVKCIKYPCANVYSNKCEACKDPIVEYYTEGECPSDLERV